MIASIFCSAIRRRAFSSRARRSAAVIGLAFDRIDVSASMLGGSGPFGAALRPRCAAARVTEAPTAAPATARNDRREIMDGSVALILSSLRRRQQCRARRRERHRPAALVQCGDRYLD